MCEYHGSIVNSSFGFLFLSYIYLHVKNTVFVCRNLVVNDDEPWVKETLSQEIQQDIIEENVKFVKQALSQEIQQEIMKENAKSTASSGPDPNRLPLYSRFIIPSTTNSNAEKTSSNLIQKKFDVQEVEIWILLASMFGAISALITLALITFSLWKLKIFTKKYPDIYKISRV